MRRFKTAILVISFFILGFCIWFGVKERILDNMLPPSPPVATAEALPEEKEEAIPEVQDDGYERVMIAGTEVKIDGWRAVEPDSALDIEKMVFSDFGYFFTESYDTERERYRLLSDEDYGVEVVHIKGKEEGKTVYIVAGVHGDERAAWYAGTLLKNATLKAGELYIIAPANVPGAAVVRRYIAGSQDLNRCFPGNPEGEEGERLAWAILCDIEEKQPDLVLDLHEAIVYSPSSRDFLGSTYIFTILTGIEDMFMDMLFATQEGTLCHNEFGYTGPGPIGSINNTVSTRLGIPTITVERFRGFSIMRRVADQLDTVSYVLEYWGMR